MRIKCPIWLALAVSIPALADARLPRVVISVQGATLRLESTAGRRVYPVGVGRVGTDSKARTPLGRWRTGRDPADTDAYQPARREPAFHRGLPFLRLFAPGRGEVHFGIHGPITPSLIWGQVSAGCIRMRPGDLRQLFAVARRHPAMEVRIIKGLDLVRGRPVRLSPVPHGRGGRSCGEARAGVRRLQRIRIGGSAVGRVCGGVDHWYAVQLAGGDLVRIDLDHSGGLEAKLYGFRAISPVASGERGFVYRVPLARRNGGARYLRIHAASRERRAVSYTLQVGAL